MSSFAYKENLNLELTGKVAAIAGGTQGIGSATAERYAKAGASVYIIGRNSTLGDQVVVQLKKVAKDPSSQHFEFIQANLSLVSSLKTVAATLTSKAGSRGIDYFLTTAGVTPNGKFSLNSEGHNSFFAIQVLGRFGLAYLLAKAGTIKESILFVCAPGGKDASPPDVEDLELIKAAEEKRYGIVISGNQGSAVLDAVIAQFAKEFPSIRSMHAFPGLVATNAIANSDFPFPVAFIFGLLLPILSRTIGNSAQGYAEIPVYLTANEKSRESGLNYFNEKLQDQRPNWIDEKPELVTAVYRQMVAMMEA